MPPSTSRLLAVAVAALGLIGAVMSQRANITMSGKQLLVDGTPFFAKGVCWNPVGFNKTNQGGRDYAGFVKQDADLMAKAGINVVRTYDPIEDRFVLDEFWKRGIWVVMNVYIYFDPEPSQVVADRIRKVKDHPSILFWEIGNEWNYNCLYDNSAPCKGEQYTKTMERVKEAGLIAKQEDPSRPVAHCYGELPNMDDPVQANTFEYLNMFDAIGINSYRGIDFSNLFDDFASRTDKPMYMGEFGADAWDSRPMMNLPSGNANLTAQADATRELTHQIHRQASVHGGGPVFGEFIFEFADEWWKDTQGTDEDHDVGGGAPGFGPWPDEDFNEEWWGITDIWRNPRPAYFEYARIPNPMAVKQGQCAQFSSPAPPPPSPEAPPVEESASRFEWMEFLAGTGISTAVSGLCLYFTCRPALQIDGPMEMRGSVVQ